MYFWSEIFKGGEFQITKDPLVVDIWRIAEKDFTEPHLCVFCGSYASPAVFGIAALAAVEDYRSPPRRTHGLRSLHAPEVSDYNAWSKILGRVSELSFDQISFFEELLPRVLGAFSA